MFQLLLEFCYLILSDADAFDLMQKGDCVSLNDYSITDAEYLYMIRQMNEDAMERLRNHYVRLLWRRSHDMFNDQMPMGTSVEDIHQEAYIGFKEAIFAFSESKQVGLAYYLNLCVQSSIKTSLRKCRSGNFKALNPHYSLDIQVGEDESISRIDLVKSDDFMHDPAQAAIYLEVKESCDEYLDTLKCHEQKVYALREEGHTYTEIAKRLNISSKDVDNIVQKIRRNLQKLFNT